ncbi:MAG: flagellar hook-length control protein FliK [Firmicutes bacterium]|nr:flagellar hook-length control protein FliK [Bacillota bacterium]
MKVATVAPSPTGQCLVPGNRPPEGEGMLDFAAILAGLCASLPAEQAGAEQAGDGCGAGEEAGGGAVSAMPPDLAGAEQAALAGDGGGELMAAWLPFLVTLPPEAAAERAAPAEANGAHGGRLPGATAAGSAVPDPAVPGAGGAGVAENGITSALPEAAQESITPALPETAQGGTASLPEAAKASREGPAEWPVDWRGEEPAGGLKAQAPIPQGPAPEGAIAAAAAGAVPDQRAGSHRLGGAGDSTGGEKGEREIALPEAATEPAARGESRGAREAERSQEGGMPSRNQAGPDLQQSGSTRAAEPTPAPQLQPSTKLPESGAASSDPAAAVLQPAPEAVAPPEAAAEPGEPIRPAIPGFKDNLLQELQGRLLYIRERGEFPAEMRLQLYPPELGEVTIRVFSRKGKLSAAIIAELPVVRDLLAGSMAELRQRFQQCNLPLEQLDLFAAGRDGEGSRHYSAGDYPGTAWRPRTGGAAVSAGPALEREPLPETAWGGGHVIDYRA